MRAICIAIALCALPLWSARADESLGASSAEGSGGFAGSATVAAVLPVLNVALIERGRGVYERFCISCHGERGDGRGISAEWLTPRPRDFTRGVFKFRSTPTGKLPTTDDLLNTVRRGLHHTNMPSWEVIGERNLRAVVEYIKTFSPRWKTEPPAAAVPIAPQPADDAQSRARGKEVYVSMGCFNCHGNAGRGDGPSAADLKDDWGDKITPFDFSSGARLKNGDKPEDVYRTFMTGLDGTPMPSYADSLKPVDAWALVHYLRTLQERTPR
jgi:mono/diheme cytochrome c family protein